MAPPIANPSLPKLLPSHTSRRRLPTTPLPAPPPPRRPWITATVITTLLHIAKIQNLPSSSPSHPSAHHSLPPEILTPLQEEWHHIVHDTFARFQSALRCLECGDRVDWCGDEGVVWYLESLRGEMDGTEVEDVSEDRCERWDGGFEKLRALIGERVGKEGVMGACWFGMDEVVEEKKWGEVECSSAGEDENAEVEFAQMHGDDEGEASPRLRREDGNTEGVRLIEGLEALYERGAELTADGFVRYGSPLWGSVTDEPLDGNATKEVVEAQRFVRFKSPLCGSDDDESLDEDKFEERSLIDDSMDQNYIFEECEDEVDSREPIAQHQDIDIEEYTENEQEDASSDNMEVQEPTISKDIEVASLSSDSANELSGGNDEIEDETIEDDFQNLARNDGMELGEPFNSQFESGIMDQANNDIEAMEGVMMYDEMELDTCAESDTENHPHDFSDSGFEANLDILGDIDADFEELFGSDLVIDESYDKEPETDDHRYTDSKTHDEVKVDEDTHPDVKIEGSSVSDLISERSQASEIEDENELFEDGEQILGSHEDKDEVDVDDQNDCLEEHHHQGIQDSEQELLWGDIYQDAIKDEDDEDEHGLSGFANLPGLPTKCGSSSNTESDPGAVIQAEESENVNPMDESPDPATDDGMDIHTIVEPTKSVEAMQEIEGAHLKDEIIPYVPIGYGVQFQGVRIWQGDESEESEEE
ncbi:hypothetical protein VTL71DRAFT_9614 [Oculimacula yallundae]|uniref:Uncharacterized protein n=1 Tax=Oculimacula yallundae TaxID=86028 RepID=A0ABR4BRB6_9HELO